MKTLFDLFIEVLSVQVSVVILTVTILAVDDRRQQRADVYLQQQRISAYLHVYSCDWTLSQQTCTGV